MAGVVSFTCPLLVLPCRIMPRRRWALARGDVGNLSGAFSLIAQVENRAPPRRLADPLLRLRRGRRLSKTLDFSFSAAAHEQCRALLRPAERLDDRRRRPSRKW